jgi:prepilin-type processing-associated H-X9-DG protein
LTTAVAAPTETVLAYENPALASEEMTHVLYADGHVVYENKAQFEQNLKKTYEVLKKQMPELQWAPIKKCQRD